MLNRCQCGICWKGHCKKVVNFSATGDWRKCCTAGGGGGDRGGGAIILVGMTLLFCGWIGIIIESKLVAGRLKGRGFRRVWRQGHDGSWQDSGHWFLKNMMVAGRICWRQGHVDGWAKWPAIFEIHVGGWLMWELLELSLQESCQYSATWEEWLWSEPEGGCWREHRLKKLIFHTNSR